MPSVSIVTNGYLIDDELIEKEKKYPGNLKFNNEIEQIKKILDFAHNVEANGVKFLEQLYIQT